MKIAHSFQKILNIENLFLVDAAILSAAGAFLIVFPASAAPHFPGQTWATPWAIRALGSVLAMAAMMSLVLAQTTDRRTLFHGTILFAAAHLFLALLLYQSPLQYGPVQIGSMEIRGGSCTISDGKEKKEIECLPFFENLGFRHPWLSQVAWIQAIVFVAALVQGNWRSGNTGSLRGEWERRIRETAGQEERNRLARELHDSIKQQIFAIQTSVAAAQARLANSAEGVEAALADARQSAREATVEMETMLEQLQAAPLEIQGLIAGIRKQCEALGFRTGAKVAFEIGDLPAADKPLPPGAFQALYRIAQESISNIGKHARASQVSLKLGLDTYGNLSLLVQDDGQGFDVVNGNRGMGLRNLHSRAQEVGGMVAIQSEVGKGTLIEVYVPTNLPLRDPLQAVLRFLVLFGLLVPFFDRFSVLSCLLGAGITAVAAVLLRRRKVS